MNHVYEYNQKDYTKKTSLFDIFRFLEYTRAQSQRIWFKLNKWIIFFNVTNVRYNSEYVLPSKSSFFSADIDSNTVIDAKASFAIPALKATLEIGGNNIGGDNYVSHFLVLV